MYSPSYGGGGVAVYSRYPPSSQYYGSSYSYRSSDLTSGNYGGYSNNFGYSASSLPPITPFSSRRSVTSSIPARGMSIPPSSSYSISSSTPTRGLSVAPSSRLSRARSHIRSSGQDEILSENRHMRLKSPSIPRETTRDELIDSIIHTRTREHRPLPGFKSASDYDERRGMRIDCDKVFDGIILGNGDTICNIQYLKGIGVTHVLNTAEHHVEVNPAKYPCYGIKYYGFHVDDLPEANISRYFPTTTSFIDSAINSGGLVVVNCVMGWSRSASVVAAYLVMKHKMKATKALELIRQNRNIRPNAGFLQQLADLENTLQKREHW